MSDLMIVYNLSCITIDVDSIYILLLNPDLLHCPLTAHTPPVPPLYPTSWTTVTPISTLVPNPSSASASTWICWIWTFVCATKTLLLVCASHIGRATGEALGPSVVSWFCLPGSVHKVISKSSWVVCLHRSSIHWTGHWFQHSWEGHHIRLWTPSADVHPPYLCCDCPMRDLHVPVEQQCCHRFPIILAKYPGFIPLSECAPLPCVLALLWRHCLLPQYEYQGKNHRLSLTYAFCNARSELCAFTGHPSTGQDTDFNTRGKDTIYVFGPPPLTSTPRISVVTVPWESSMCRWSNNAAIVYP